MIRVPESEVANRLAGLQRSLLKRGVGAAIIRQYADLYYFTGTVQDSHLVVPATGDPVLLVRRSMERAMAESPIRKLLPLLSMSGLTDVLAEVCSGNIPGVIGMELDVLPVNLFSVYQKEIFPDRNIVDISGPVRRLRSIKSPWEIQMMRRSAEISTLVAESVPRLLRPGITELELNADLEAIARKAGHTGALRLRSFNLEMGFGHILSGPNAAIPSYSDAPTGGPGLGPAFGQGAGARRIGPGEIVSVDLMVCRDGYNNDMARNYCIGPPPSRLATAYEFVRSVHERFRELARPGLVSGDLFRTVMKWGEEAGWGQWFMGHAEPRVTFIGHGIGIEVDEFPFIAEGHKLVLEEGMTFAFEPKVIIPNEGIAGLENTYLVTSGGLESLNSPDEELVII